MNRPTSSQYQLEKKGTLPKLAAVEAKESSELK